MEGSQILIDPGSWFSHRVSSPNTMYLLFLKENWYWFRFACSLKLFMSFSKSEFEAATNTMSSA